MSLDIYKANFEIRQWDNNTININVNSIDINLVNKDNYIKFYNADNEAIDDCKEVSQVFSGKDCVYLEWVNKYTGQYLYYNMMDIVLQLQSTVIHTDILSNRSRLKSIDVNDLHLNPNDYIILSGVRNLYSLSKDFSLIGEYHDSQLYLGRWPTVPFLKQHKVSVTFNCCKAKAEEVEQLSINEILFDVANWKYSLIDELKSQNKNAIKNNNMNDIKVHKSKQLQILDAKIDEMHEFMCDVTTILLVHCHAGMHRSAFIVGCYLMKYGGFRNETAETIYSFMKQKRSIVQEFGYDRTLKRYQQYLDTKQEQNQTNCSCCIL